MHENIAANNIERRITESLASNRAGSGRIVLILNHQRRASVRFSGSDKRIRIITKRFSLWLVPGSRNPLPLAIVTGNRFNCYNHISPCLVIIISVLLFTDLKSRFVSFRPYFACKLFLPFFFFSSSFFPVLFCDDLHENLPE